jgi:GDP/UDP-N,N'-diacetylbacillosamine 2-epimerase (hydrolysing)
MEDVNQSEKLELQVVVTGMHLSPEFGLTYRDIESDGFKITRKVESLLSSDTPSGIAKSMGLGMIGFADALAELGPDLVLVLGDRYEIFAAASAAMVARIPIAHIHGGETTEGLIDEAIRHSITKMSHLHFVATEIYRNRVLQMGEAPDRVFNVGGLGVDGLVRQELFGRKELEESLGMQFGHRSLIITFHPVTLEDNTAEYQFSQLLIALDHLQDTTLIFTLPNADTNGRALIGMVEQFVASHTNSSAYTSLGQQRYLSCLQYVDGVVGNSSSGLMEVPSFHKGTVNIGDRQRGRIKTDSVIDCQPESASIAAAVDRLFSDEFQKTLRQVENPYGYGGSSKKIVDIIESVPIENLVFKRFVDKDAT